MNHLMPEENALKLTLVLGATENPERYAYKAIRQLRACHIQVIAVGRKEGRVGDVPVLTAIPKGVTVNTVTIYLSSKNQENWQQTILELKPERLIFNPGAENESFATQARQAGIKTEQACTLVLLATGAY